MLLFLTMVVSNLVTVTNMAHVAFIRELEAIWGVELPVQVQAQKTSPTSASLTYSLVPKQVYESFPRPFNDKCREIGLYFDPSADGSGCGCSGSNRATSYPDGDRDLEEMEPLAASLEDKNSDEQKEECSISELVEKEEEAPSTTTSETLKELWSNVLHQIFNWDSCEAFFGDNYSPNMDGDDTSCYSLKTKCAQLEQDFDRGKPVQMYLSAWDLDEIAMSNFDGTYLLGDVFCKLGNMRQLVDQNPPGKSYLPKFAARQITVDRGVTAVSAFANDDMRGNGSMSDDGECIRITFGPDYFYESWDDERNEVPGVASMMTQQDHNHRLNQVVKLLQSIYLNPARTYGLSGSPKGIYWNEVSVERIQRRVEEQRTQRHDLCVPPPVEDYYEVLATYGRLCRYSTIRACLLTHQLLDYIHLHGEENDSLGDIYNILGPEVATRMAAVDVRGRGTDTSTGRWAGPGWWTKLDDEATTTADYKTTTKSTSTYSSESTSIPLSMTIGALRSVGRMNWGDNRIDGWNSSFVSIKNSDEDEDTQESWSIPELVAIPFSDDGSTRYRAELFHLDKVQQGCLPDDATILWRVE